MGALREIAISLPGELFGQAESVAEQLGLAPSELFVRAIAEFVGSYQPAHAAGAEPSGAGRRVIAQGDIYWVRALGASAEAAGDGTVGDEMAGNEIGGSEIAGTIPHPYVVIQENLLNHSRIETVVACALTSNLRRASETPGNLLLDAGEAGLPRQSVVEVSKVTTLAKAQLGEYIGSVGERRVEQILAGMRFLQASTRQI